jgi:Ni,Fe-hydrogenase III small subunit
MELMRASPRQADLMIVAGRVSRRKDRGRKDGLTRLRQEKIRGS